jgi:hypothetical protein
MTLANDLNPENCFDPFEAPSLAVSHAMLKGKSDFVLPRVRELPRMRELVFRLS